MKTAIIGVGNIGKAVASDLVTGGEEVILAARTKSKADALASELGAMARSATVSEAVGAADVVLFAVWLDVIKELVQELGSELDGKVVIDPSNPIADSGGGKMTRTLPADQSAASVISGLLPSGARLVKAFGTLGAADLTGASRRSPEWATLFFATDDDSASTVVQQLIAAAGFESVGVGGLKEATRIEMFGDLHQFGGLNGGLLSTREARAAVDRVGA